jgi:tetratricopeptide (TPR) repeat protein
VHYFALDEALGQLVEMSLVDATDELDLAQRRYSVHPLTRAFAEAKLRQLPETERAARRRLAEYIRSFAREYGGDWHYAGFTHLEPELPNILVVIQWCLEQKLVDLSIDIIYRVCRFMISYGYWNDAMNQSQQALALATEVGDELNAASLRDWPVGWIYRHWGDLEAAEEQITQALTVFERLGTDESVARAKRHLGRIALEHRELVQAEALFKESLEFYQSSEYERQRYQVIANLANVAMEQDDLSTAWTLCHSVLEPARRFGDPERVSHLLGVLSGVARRRGDLEQAKVYGEESLALAREIRRLDAIANGQFWLAKTEMEIGSERSAKQRLLDALEIYRRLDMQSNVRETKALLAELAGPADQTGREEAA